MSENFKNNLYGAILSLATREECDRFFSDLCTEREIADLSARLRVAMLLDGGVNYNDIAAQTGASTATISRVSKCLSGRAGGYRLVLKRPAHLGGAANRQLSRLSSSERAALNLRELFIERGYLDLKLPELVDFAPCDYSRVPASLIVLQDADGRVKLLSPSPEAAIFSLGLSEGTKISYSYKSAKREPLSPAVFLDNVGIFYSGAADTETKCEILSLAAQAAKHKVKGARLSLFNAQIIEFMLKKSSLCDDELSYFFTHLNSNRDDALSFLEELKDSYFGETYALLLLLFDREKSAAQKLAEMKELLPYPELAACFAELEAILSSLSDAETEIAPTGNIYFGKALVFAEKNARLTGAEYKTAQYGMGFNIINE